MSQIATVKRDHLLIDGIRGAHQVENPIFFADRLNACGDWMTAAEAPPAELAPALARWSEWTKIARPHQLPPSDDFREWLIRGDRQSGKTRAAAEYLSRCSDDPGLRAVLITEGEKQVHYCAGELHKACGSRIWSDGKIVKFPNGGTLVWLSKDRARYRLQGSRFNFIWLDELFRLKNPNLAAEIIALRDRGARIIWSG